MDFDLTHSSADDQGFEVAVRSRAEMRNEEGVSSVCDYSMLCRNLLMTAEGRVKLAGLWNGLSLEMLCHDSTLGLVPHRLRDLPHCETSGCDDRLLWNLPVDGAVCALSYSNTFEQPANRTELLWYLLYHSEVITSQKYSLSADIYSFGVIIWEICEAAAPFADLPPATIPIAVVTEKKRPPISVRTPQVEHATVWLYGRITDSRVCFAGSASARSHSALLARGTCAASDGGQGGRDPGWVLSQGVA